jgi:hypothetical protein
MTRRRVNLQKSKSDKEIPRFLVNSTRWHKVYSLVSLSKGATYYSYVKGQAYYTPSVKKPCNPKDGLLYLHRII